MDSLTHIIVGASVGEAILGKKAGKKAMFYGALAGSAPDVDAVINFFVSDVDSLLMHRGITHSIFTALISGPLIGWLLWSAYKKQNGHLIPWILLFTVNILLHDFLDTATMYGTALLSPFSDYRYSFDNIFVVDPLFTLPLVISFTALVILKSTHPYREKWNSFGLGISTLYMAFTFTNHNGAINALNATVDLSEKNKNDYFAAPTLFNSILWNVVIKEGDGYKVGYYSVFDSDSTVHMYTLSKNDELISKIPNREDFDKLVKFSKGFYSLTEKEGNIYFNDLRFGQVEGWSNPSSNFGFSFNLTPGADNTMVVQQGRIEGTEEDVLAGMWKRMKGN